MKKINVSLETEQGTQKIGIDQRTGDHIMAKSTFNLIRELEKIEVVVREWNFKVPYLGGIQF